MQTLRLVAFPVTLFRIISQESETSSLRKKDGIYPVILLRQQVLFPAIVYM